MGVLFSFLLSTRARVLCGFCTVRFWRLEPNICLSITCAQAEAFCRAFIADSKLMASRRPSPHEDVLKRWHLS
jgi:hypothetical protein